MKKLLVLTALFLSACTGGQFGYDRQNSCEVSYGLKHISVIVDKQRTIVRNNNMEGANVILNMRTADRNYSTMGRYFPEDKSADIVNSLSNSEKVYLDWYNTSMNSAMNRANRMYRTIIDTRDFKARYNECVTQQRSRS